ncbi:MAG TPA: sigma-54 dependent transcriptional regulator [Longimicrobiaceae bacterium]|nr:sigma-54 dependent transcriptional regulator [Longimicrobiaceae bacterium]
MAGPILLIDADARSERVLRAALGAGTRLRVETTLTGGLQALAEERWRATLLSLELPGADLALAVRISEEERAGRVMVVAAHPTPDLVLEATRRGLAEVLTLPLEVEAVARVFAGSVREGRVALPEVGQGRELVGSSPSLLEVFKTVGRVAGSPATVLITGESGTGKELVARAIHAASGRAGAEFVAVNCAAIPEDLLESELFGHERGAFTGAVARKVGRFERANRGTLFLDEIGDMSLVLQAKILRALQEREIERLGGEERIRVDVRVVAATHRDLEARMGAGEFREDLYYRLAVVRLNLAPLRERPGDVRALALHYAARFAAEYGRDVRYLGEGALARLEAHPWPGNVRELRNVIERAVLVAQGGTIGGADVVLDAPRASAGAAGPWEGYSPTLPLAEVERLHLARVLESVGGQVSRAAEVLGVHRNTVTRKLREHGLDGGRM